MTWVYDGDAMLGRHLGPPKTGGPTVSSRPHPIEEARDLGLREDSVFYNWSGIHLARPDSHYRAYGGKRWFAGRDERGPFIDQIADRRDFDVLVAYEGVGRPLRRYRTYDEPIGTFAARGERYCRAADGRQSDRPTPGAAYAVEHHGSPFFILGTWSPWIRLRRLNVVIEPGATDGRVGVAIGYRHGMRNAYVGVAGGETLFVCRTVGHAFELVAQAPLTYEAGDSLALGIVLAEGVLRVAANGTDRLGAEMEVEPGGFALVTERPARYRRLLVEGEACGAIDSGGVPSKRRAPGRMRLAGRFETAAWGANDVRCVDLFGDGGRQLLFVQSERLHPTRNLYRDITCITATDLKGGVIWQIGEPNRDHALTTAGLPVAVGDLAEGGRVLLCGMGQALQVRHAATARIIRTAPMPEALPGMYGEGAETDFPRVLGDQIVLLRRSDGSKAILTKDRYNHVWAFDEALRPLWHYFGNTGHHLYPLDVDGDGADEVFFGGRLLDGSGRVLWDLNLADHLDVMTCGPFRPDAADPFTMVMACGEEGLILTDRRGTVLARRSLGHTQSVSAASLVPGRSNVQIVAVSAWGYPGVTWVVAPDGATLSEFRGHSTTVYAPAAGRPALIVKRDGLIDWQGQAVAAFEDGPEHRHSCSVAPIGPDGTHAVLGIRSDRVSIYEPDDNLTRAVERGD